MRCGSDEQALRVAVEKLDLRTAPGIRSEVGATLQQGDRLQDLGQVSPFESEISFNGQPQRAPWIKVQTPDKRQGWVFAAALTPPAGAEHWLLHKRLECYFGRPFTERVLRWQHTLEDIRDEQQFAASYREAIQLRDIIVRELERRADQDGRPDHFWLNEVMPGFVYQRAFRFGPPQLLADYRFWGKKAQQSAGEADNQFVGFCFRIFPRDSIESRFPVWRFQIAEMDGASQLGTGAHLTALTDIDALVNKSRLFEAELLQYKTGVLNDILDQNTQFWQDQPLLLQELDQLMAAPLNCVGAAERNALERRRTMLLDPEKNWIKVNLRSGE